jgi:hypothetical protein
MSSLMRNAYTAVIARGETWQGAVQTEPYEAAWAGEAVFFVRVLEADGSGEASAKVQISPDGMHWVDEGAELKIEARAGHLSFSRVVNFGGWLRLAVQVPSAASLTVVATLALKA